MSSYFKRIEYVAESTSFSRRRTARLLIVAHEHGILANNFYVFPTYSYIVASSEQPHTLRPAEYDNCNYLARASVNFNIRHGAEYIPVPLIYNLLVSQIRHAAVQKITPNGIICRWRCVESHDVHFFFQAFYNPFSSLDM